MKIRTQFTLTMIVFGLLLVAVAGSLAFTHRQVDRLTQQEQIAHNIERIARELSYLSNDYLLYQEIQQRHRWEAKFSSLNENLALLTTNDPEQEILVAQILANQGHLEAVFADIVSILEKAAQDPAVEPDLEFIQMSWSRMEVQNQGIVFDVSLLAEMFRDQADRLNRANLVLIFVLAGIFGAYIITTYWMIYRRILRSLAEFQAGTQVIGSGNLEYILDTNRADEIGDLSQAFNQMTANLRTITASKRDLEREIAEREQVELALAQANASLRTYTEELKRSNQALEDFAFIASHDLREPLRKVRVFGERLLSGHGHALDGQARDYIQRMQSSVVRMESMLDGLLAYSRITTQNQPFTEVDLRQIAAEVVSDLEVRIAQTGGRVEIGDLPVIEADPVQMRQVLLNLVGNGLKFHQPNLPPVVKVYGRASAWEGKGGERHAPGAPANHRIEIVVEDNGIGFDMQKAGGLFKPFHRLVEKNIYEGTGMGLAICRKIAERHWGCISAHSAPGQGSTFILVLPSRQGPEGQARA